jgi:type II secretory pathway pseudopilin PulG
MDWIWKDRRRAQAGTTLVELLVSLVVIGLALTLIIGIFSTALLDATIAKRNTAVEVVARYELDKIHASAFNTSPRPYSECFATESPNAPQLLGDYQDPCADNRFSLRADVTLTTSPSANVQIWSVSIVSWPDAAPVGNPLSVLKVNR